MQLCRSVGYLRDSDEQVTVWFLNHKGWEKTKSGLSILWQKSPGLHWAFCTTDCTESISTWFGSIWSVPGNHWLWSSLIRIIYSTRLLVFLIFPIYLLFRNEMTVLAKSKFSKNILIPEHPAGPFAKNYLHHHLR